MHTLLFVASSYVPDDAFVSKMNKEGIDVVCVEDVPEMIPGETLPVTDNPKVYPLISPALVIIKDESDIDRFSGATYFCMDPQDNDPVYFERIWKRINKLPWIIARTERLIIRETIEEDVDSFYIMYKDHEMTRFTDKVYEYPEEEKKYVREYRDRVYSIYGYGIWTLLRKKDSAVIGRAGLVSRGEADEVEIGFAIGRDYQRKGYAREAVSKCIEIARELEFKKVNALVMPENIASSGLLKSLGFVMAGEEESGNARYIKLALNLRV